MKVISVARLLVAFGGAAILSGCDRAPTPGEATGGVSATQKAAVTAAPKPVFSVNEMMVMLVDRPGELLWNIEREGHAPKSDEDWYQLENHAVEVASAGTLLQLGGTGPEDAGWAAKPSWQAYSEGLTRAGLTARAAAKAKDMESLVKANSEIVDACEACHNEFKPDIPTGGLFIHLPPAAATPN